MRLFDFIRRRAGVGTSPPSVNPLTGKPLRYLIGTDAPGPGRPDEVIEVSYSVARPPAKGMAIAYCNLFDEEGTGKYGPYLHTSDTAKQYGEGQIDPAGPGWDKNLREQFLRRKRQGFAYVELDNPDAYRLSDVLRAVDRAGEYGLKVIAKNPLLMEGDPTPYLAHPDVFGAIVERGAGDPVRMDRLRKAAGKPDLPIWFVAFGAGRAWADDVSNKARGLKNMGVTVSAHGEYRTSTDILRPA